MAMKTIEKIVGEVCLGAICLVGLWGAYKLFEEDIKKTYQKYFKKHGEQIEKNGN